MSKANIADNGFNKNYLITKAIIKPNLCLNASAPNLKKCVEQGLSKALVAGRAQIWNDETYVFKLLRYDGGSR